MAGPDVRTRRWTRIEYARLIEAGFFRTGDPVELLGGQMVVAEPQGSRHFAALRATQEALRAAFGTGWGDPRAGPAGARRGVGAPAGPRRGAQALLRLPGRSSVQPVPR